MAARSVTRRRTLLSGLGRAAWVGVGLVAVAIGGIGVIIPGLPSTIFFLFAAWCFARSNERLERWVLDLPGVGPLVRDARAGLGMPRRTKWSAIAIMWAAIALSTLVLRDRPVGLTVVAALGVMGTLCILVVVPTRERVLAQRAAADTPG